MVLHVNDSNHPPLWLHDKHNTHDAAVCLRNILFKPDNTP